MTLILDRIWVINIFLPIVTKHFGVRQHQLCSLLVQRKKTKKPLKWATLYYYNIIQHHSVKVSSYLFKKVKNSD